MKEKEALDFFVSVSMKVWDQMDEAGRDKIIEARAVLKECLPKPEPEKAP